MWPGRGRLESLVLCMLGSPLMPVWHAAMHVWHLAAHVGHVAHTWRKILVQKRPIFFAAATVRPSLVKDTAIAVVIVAHQMKGTLALCVLWQPWALRMGFAMGFAHSFRCTTVIVLS